MRIAVTALALGLAAIATGVSAQQITGAGATFPAPVYTKWGEAAKASTNIELNYQAIGSGGGQNQILNRTVDFGASDAPMDPAKLVDGKLLQFPTVMGAVVIIVNLSDVKPDEIKLTGEVLADIFAGNITKWNDPKLVALNPGMKLPNLAIAPVHRADGSGTTFVFTSYLSAVSPDWKSKVGANTSVNWPAGAGAKGNDGVAATTKNTRGGIGYVENAYATQNHLITTQLRNQAGKFVEPTIAAAQATLASIEMPADLIAWGPDPEGAESYPIVTYTWIMAYKEYPDAAKGKALKNVLEWCLGEGQKESEALGYIPLPEAVTQKAKAALDNIAAGGSDKK